LNSRVVRLGGMALSNGVLVHGPTAWACAIRGGDGRIQVAAQRKRVAVSRVTNPALRGPAGILEVLALLSQVKRALPAARLPFERPGVVAAMAGAASFGRVVRRSHLRPLTQELAGGLLALAPALFVLRRGEVAGYHGAEHVAIGSYEHGERRPREHERCGTHLVGPALVAGAAGNAAVRRLPARLRPAGRVAASLGSLAVSSELFAWMTRHPEHPVAQLLARPGHELQHRLATDEPTPAQLEVAGAALQACLRLEDVDDDA
jgi:uncharacterized protein YqhQ